MERPSAILIGVSTVLLALAGSWARAGTLSWDLSFTSTDPGIGGNLILTTSDALTGDSINTVVGYALESVSGTVDGGHIGSRGDLAERCGDLADAVFRAG